MDEFRIGASYYPEWWTEEEWEADFSKMAALGFNVIRTGEFAWSWYEPREGEFNFAPMERAVNLAAKHGIKTIMCTTTAVCPPWLYKKYPEVKGGNDRGDYDFGGRKGQCLSSAVFLEYAEKITRAQAAVFGKNENVIGWQLDNEPGFPFWDYDDRCEAGFRVWLKQKYGTIDALNKAWCTMMWSNVYNDFDEIDLPVNAAEGGWSPGLQLDYRRYFSFTFNRLLGMEARIIREFNKKQFIYTNWPGANWSVDCFEALDYLDYTGWDNYVGQPVGDRYRVQLRASMEHSFNRRLSGEKKRFLVAEQRAVAGANGVPDVIRAQTWLNVSHGAFATIFFEWRTPLGGVEQAYESVLDRSLRVNECEAIFKKLSSELREHYHLIDDAETVSDIGAIYSHENSWAMPGWRVDGFYDEEFFNAYGGFKNALARNVDVLSVKDDFSNYRVIVAPNLKIISEEDAARLKKYVQDGGILVINTETGTRDSFNRILELAEPVLFADAAGAQVASRANAGQILAETGEQMGVEFQTGAKATLRNQVFKLSLATAEPAAIYTAGRLKGKPAVTVNRYGKGFIVLYACDGNDVYFYEALAGYIRERFAISPIARVDDGIIISTRKQGDDEYIMAVNMKDTPVSLTLDTPCDDILSGGIAEGRVTLEGYGVFFARIK